MKWIMKEQNQELLNKTINSLNGDFILDRLCYNLNIKKDYLLKYIDSDNAKTLLATILINRGLEEYTDIINNPSTYLLNPSLLVNADKAAEVINRYCRNKNAYIYVYADYDVDGLTSGYVMTTALQQVARCQSVTVKYPEREEGYGLSLDWCKKLVQNHNDYDEVLVITVDNGITKVKEVEYLKQHNIEVVITDHHTSKEVTPNCICVDPHNNTIEQDDTYQHLCGCGVAFKVAQLVQELNGVNHMYDFFPYLALATIADVMPMHIENMAFIQYGLDIINSDKCPIGIKELKALEDIDIVTGTTIGWTIGPMLNACGRMGDVELASKMFFTDNEPIKDIVAKIKSTNDKRKRITKKAAEQLSKTEHDNNSFFVLNTDKFPGGVLGIIAGKATEIFGKPSIIVTPIKKGGKLLHGSARTVNGIDLMPYMNILQEEGLIKEFGGHSEAIGIKIYEDKLEEVSLRLNELLPMKEVSIEDLANQHTEDKEELLIIDEILTLDNINIITTALANMLPSEGKDVINPTFAVTDCEVKSFKVYPSGYMELTLKQGNTVLDMSAMGYAETFSTQILPQLDGKEKKLVHIAGTLTKHFKTKKYVLNIRDIIAA